MKDELIQNLPGDLKSRIFIEMCGKLRETKFRETIPYKELQNELLADKFHNRIKIEIDDMDILLVRALIEYELDQLVDVNYSDFQYYRATTTRFYFTNSTEYIQVCGYSGHDEIKELVCEHCNTNSIILSHKKKIRVCKNCNIEY